MRVCLIYDCLFPWTVGGAERWMRNVAEALAAEGHDVTYLTRRQWPEAQPPEIKGVTVIAVSREEPLYGADGNRTIGEPLRFGWGVLRHLRKHGGDYDLVHTAAFPYFSLLAAGAQRRRGGYSIVADWHEVWSDSYWREYLGRSRGAVARRIQRACARVPQQAFCFSQLHARRLEEIGLQSRPIVLRGEFVPDGDPVGPDDAAAPREPHAVFAGRLIAEKQAPAVIPAIARAARSVPGLRGTVFGEGPQKREVDAAIAALGSDAPVVARGFVAAEELDAAMRAATCMVLPSKREGYGMVVVEAAFAGTPSVVVRGEDNAAVELVEDGVNGVVAPSASPEDLAAAIERVHSAGPELRASTARWYAENADSLALATSLRTVLERYRSPTARL